MIPKCQNRFSWCANVQRNVFVCKYCAMLVDWFHLAVIYLVAGASRIWPGVRNPLQESSFGLEKHKVLEPCSMGHMLAVFYVTVSRILFFCHFFPCTLHLQKPPRIRNNYMHQVEHFLNDLLLFIYTSTYKDVILHLIMLELFLGDMCWWGWW